MRDRGALRLVAHMMRSYSGDRGDAVASKTRSHRMARQPGWRRNPGGYGPCRGRTYDQLVKSQLLYR